MFWGWLVGSSYILFILSMAAELCFDPLLQTCVKIWSVNKMQLRIDFTWVTHVTYCNWCAWRPSSVKLWAYQKYYFLGSFEFLTAVSRSQIADITSDLRPNKRRNAAIRWWYSRCMPLNDWNTADTALNTNQSINQSIQQTYVPFDRKMFKTPEEGPTLAQRQSKESEKNRNTSQNCPAIIERSAWFQKAYCTMAVLLSIGIRNV